MTRSLSPSTPTCGTRSPKKRLSGVIREWKMLSIGQKKSLLAFNRVHGSGPGYRNRFQRRESLLASKSRHCRSATKGEQVEFFRRSGPELAKQRQIIARQFWLTLSCNSFWNRWCGRRTACQRSNPEIHQPWDIDEHSSYRSAQKRHPKVVCGIADTPGNGPISHLPRGAACSFTYHWKVCPLQVV